MKDFLLSLRAWWNQLVAEIKLARAGTARAKDSVDILVKVSDGPVVESRDLKHPLPLRNVPVRSTKATAKKVAHEFAEKHAGRAMSWGQAQKYLAKLERENPDLEIAVPDREMQALALIEKPVDPMSTSRIIQRVREMR